MFAFCYNFFFSKKKELLWGQTKSRFVYKINEQTQFVRQLSAQCSQACKSPHINKIYYRAVERCRCQLSVCFRVYVCTYTIIPTMLYIGIDICLIPLMPMNSIY